ncbi:biotin--[acetyl-CoA-carboxylase] ligase [Hyphobacterium sp. HN65]|uniref:biotin--[biotin carboxyl-carrier protein] ligase n=1 Tax=Hyphobacterium lacteum TaxID=3116575 RepID=A0ABU7LMN7_9PROT|nr:biotin--[acetyl-CoA-carboxylase] ligase [Hyphobacterium sp. HN65]MEE2524881.1 biotin--[acetyl-CoA-carboxylase] ligase [Hyphobacterium sp. HN65]
MAPGVRIEWLDETDSTNEEARRRFRAGEIGPLWIAARRQTAGRGRRGRSWADLEQNLYCSGLYSLKCTPAEAAQLSFAAALAASDVCQTFLPDRNVRVKWPNDVLVDGKKICGVLLESADAPGKIIQLVVGVGLNTAAAPDIPDYPATSLAGLGVKASAEQALDLLTVRFEYWRSVWAREGFAPLREAWMARAHGVGQRCVARLSQETLEGVFTDLSSDGSLKLEMANGQTRLISAGDVFFPGALE